MSWEKQPPTTSNLTVSSAPELARRAIREQIASGRLRPGPVKLTDLAREFGVSPVPVREALRALEAEGLVTFNHGRSIQVNKLSVADAREIFLIRTHLESLLLIQAAPELARADGVLNRLRELLAVMDEVDESERWLDANREFHWTMYEVVELPRLLGIVRGLWVVTEPYLRIYVAADDRRVAQKEHRTMVELLEQGDGARVVEVLHAHLAATCEIVAQSLLARDRAEQGEEPADV
jgi:DNA-binding GntR family transcriptional regulator